MFIDFEKQLFYHSRISFIDNLEKFSLLLTYFLRGGCQTFNTNPYLKILFEREAM